MKRFLIEWLPIYLFVIVALVLLAGCGVTEWQRTQDALDDAFTQMNSPEFQAAVARANPGVPRVAPKGGS